MIRLRKKGQPIFILMILLTLSISIPCRPALAALIDTQTFISELDPDQFRTRFTNLLAREDVRIALLRHGINPSEVEAQIAALTDQEISQVSEMVNELPAGGMSAIAPPIALVILLPFIYILVLTGVISIGAYAGSKVKEAQEKEYAKSTPFPAPPRVGLLPSVNPNEPWTGKWKVAEGRFRGVYCFQQNGDRVVSTSECDKIVDAKVYGAMIVGTLGGTSKGRDFKATMADDFLSFRGSVDYDKYFFEALKTELKPESTTPEVNPSQPWTGKWRVQGSSGSSGLWVFKQDGQAVVSTNESYIEAKGTVTESKLEGLFKTFGKDFNFSFVISPDAMSFEGYAGAGLVRGTKVK